MALELLRAFFGLVRTSIRENQDYRASKFSMKLYNSERAHRFFRKIWDHSLIGEQEQVYVLFVDYKNRVIKWHCIHTGGVCETVIDSRTILNYIVKYKRTTGIFIAHNHPSGNIHPSEVDIALTHKLKDMCTMARIRFLDHLILTEDDFFSFKEEQLID